LDIDVEKDFPEQLSSVLHPKGKETKKIYPKKKSITKFTPTKR
jgi:hypothetical protein